MSNQTWVAPEKDILRLLDSAERMEQAENAVKTGLSTVEEAAFLFRVNADVLAARVHLPAPGTDQ